MNYLSRRHLVSRLGAVEAMQDSMDLQSYARVEDIDDLTNDIEGLQDSVAYLLMGDEQSFWPDD